MPAPLHRRVAVALFAALSITPVAAAADYVSPSEARMRSDVAYLADDAREGRGPGTKGIDAAADYIATVFKESGLKPAPGADGYFQKFTIRGDVTVGKPTELALRAPEGVTIDLELGKSFSPLSLGGSAKLEDLPIVFVGYGITAKDEGSKLDYDDYAGIDVKDKAVLLVRREPQQEKADSPFSGTQPSIYAGFRHKAANASQHEAKAVLFVNDLGGAKDGKDELLQISSAGGSGSGIPFVMITRAVADKLLAAAKAESLEDFEKAVDADLKPRSKPLEGCVVRGEVTLERSQVAVKNVIGVLEGSGPLADETIVVGGHYDHLGFGGSGSLAFGDRTIHNGADDNASGTAMVMEMARRLARRTEPLPRRVVFMAFTGEERGLLGSQHYVEHPLYPLKDTVAMLNFDMVGRLNDKGDLTIFGARTSPGFEKLITALAESQGIKPGIIPGTQAEFFASDHASFYTKDIPVLFAFTGTHGDYHRPTDDVERINFNGMTRVANLGELLLLDLAERPERPTFTKLAGGRLPVASRTGGPARAYLGSRPAYGADVKGVKLEGVSEGSPAEKAGLKGGDVIVKFDGKDVTDVEGFMELLSAKKPGDKIEVVVQREGKDVSIPVTLGSRQRD